MRMHRLLVIIARQTVVRLLMCGAITMVMTTACIAMNGMYLRLLNRRMPGQMRSRRHLRRPKAEKHRQGDEEAA